MAKNNDVFSIIPIPAATADVIVDTTKTVDDLAAGDIGVFDYNTGKALNATTAKNVNEFFVALAVDTTGDGVKDEILTSAGTKIKAKDIQSYELKCYTAATEQVVDVHSFTADCDTEYGLKIEINTDEKYMNYGFNQAAKTFIVKTGCCEGCESCGTGNCAELTKLLIDAINADEDGLMVASAFANVGDITITAAAGSAGVAGVTIDSTVIKFDLLAADTIITTAAKLAEAINATTKFSAKSDGVSKVSIVMKGAAASGAISLSTVVGSLAISKNDIATATITDLSDAATGFKAIYGDGCPSLRLTGVTQAINSYCNVNTKYYKQRTPVLTVSKVQETGFACTGTIVTTTDPVMREGAGYDLANIEYQVGGFIGKPGIYRTGDLIGVAFSDFNSVISKSTNYHMVDLTYDVSSNGGWLDYTNHFNTKFVFPCGSEADGLSTFLTVLDAAVTQSATGANGNGFVELKATAANDCAC